MRSRSIREGSVGLLIILGLSLFAGLILWLRGVSLGRRSYKVFIDFANVAGMEQGTPVRYRGVTVGKITRTRPGPNGVEVEIEISPPDLVIPKDVRVEANQSGLLGSTSIDIFPTERLTAEIEAKPLDRDCDPSLIVCNKARLQGQIGVSVDELIRASIKFADVYSQPEFFNNLNTLAKNSATAAAEVTQLTKEFRDLTRITRVQIASLSRTAESVEGTAQAFTVTAGKLGLTADQVNGLIDTNRTSLVSTLNNVNLITRDLRSTVYKLGPVVDRVDQGELLKNLEVLSANAVQASANLRDVSNALNSPTNLVVLQQTLDSARATFQNAQKITSDLEELTGDPALLDNLRKLINGLSGLVSSTDQLQQQTQVAQVLTPMLTSTTGDRSKVKAVKSHTVNSDQLNHLADPLKKSAEN
ncbi:MAG TPA: MCE family protein [Leptolyngbyaceae cyanobacterium M33_DOE_097]|uniref:MCE family protein n=1 Tax=Oscillatoriales cyanobacterium SpSt-418 TaxID=2282169 RepID=A0A7C3KC71_9CYAN|nr:MCE family protein [Leptolyngbyaceae cyanobacterium M33_DOE_097]